MKYIKLFESPDYLSKGTSQWTDMDAYPFYVDSDDIDNVFVGEAGSTHTQIIIDLYENNFFPEHIVQKWFMNYDRESDDFNEIIYYDFIMSQIDLGFPYVKYPGRVFTDDKVITFWFYPKTREELKRIIKGIEDDLQITIWDDDEWEIETNAGYHNNSMSLVNAHYVHPSEFEGSEDFTEVEFIEHIMSPLKKKKKNVPKGIGSNKEKKWKDWQKPFESADVIELVDRGSRLRYGMGYAFGEYEGKLYIGKKGVTHGDFYTMNGDINSRDDLDYPGRIWLRNYCEKFGLENGYISFWRYPEPEKLKEIIDKLEEHFDEKIWNNEYLIEVVDTPEKSIEVSDYSLGLDKFDVWQDSNDQGTLIPLEDYMGSMDWSKDIQQKQHVISPIFKNNKVPKGFGSQKIKKWKEWQKPFENKLYEDPDTIIYDDYYINYSSFNTVQIPFCFNDKDLEYDDNQQVIPESLKDAELWIGPKGGGHEENPFSGYDEPGRLFYSYADYELNILTLWYDESRIPKTLKIIVDRLEKELNHSLKGWKLEISDGEYEDLYEYIDKGVAVKADFEESRLWHLMKQDDPRRKERKVPQGFGSKKVKKFKEWEKPFENKSTKRL